MLNNNIKHKQINDCLITKYNRSYLVVFENNIILFFYNNIII